jgi:hypothetical protein
MILMTARVRWRPRAGRTVTAAALLAAVSVVAAGCLWGRTGTGDIVTETRTVGAFTRIDVSDRIGVIVAIGPAKPIEVHAQANLMPVIATDVDGGILRIHATESFVNPQPVEVVITTPSLIGITLSGSSYADVQGLAADAWDIIMSGSSRITAAGTSTTIALLASGSSQATLDALIAKTITVNVSGAADVALRATSEVRGAASGGSHVVVRGGAVVNVTKSGGATVTDA